MTYNFDFSQESAFFGSVINTVPNATITFQCLEDGVTLGLTTDSVGNPVIPTGEFVTVSLQCYLNQKGLSGAILDVPPGADMETVYFEGRLINPKIYPMPIQAQGDILAVINGQTGRIMAHRAFSSPAAAVYGLDATLGQKLAVYVQFQQGLASTGAPSGNQGSNGGAYSTLTEGTVYQVLPINSAGQTIFALKSIPTVPSDSEVYLNGVKAQYGVNYAINGQNLTWLGLTLQPTYLLEIYYF